MAQFEKTILALKDRFGDQVSTGSSVLDLHASDEAHHRAVSAAVRLTTAQLFPMVLGHPWKVTSFRFTAVLRWT